MAVEEWLEVEMEWKNLQNQPDMGDKQQIRFKRKFYSQLLPEG